jgi:hypothetical protein
MSKNMRNTDKRKNEKKRKIDFQNEAAEFLKQTKTLKEYSTLLLEDTATPKDELKLLTVEEKYPPKDKQKDVMEEEEDEEDSEVSLSDDDSWPIFTGASSDYLKRNHERFVIKRSKAKEAKKAAASVANAAKNNPFPAPSSTIEQQDGVSKSSEVSHAQLTPN